MTARRTGFTFVEAVLAATILAVTASAVFEGLHAATTAVRSARNEAIACALAGELLARAEADGFDALEPRKGTSDRPGFEYELEISPTDLDTLRAIRLTVSWRDGERPRSLVFETAVAARRTGR